MRRMALIAGFVILALGTGLGQGYITHGISPSVTSITPSNPHPGIAPSVTSVTPAPNWWTGTIAQPSAGTRHHHHHNNGTPYGYYYYPYYPSYPYYDEPADSGYAQPAQQAVAEQPEAPAQTIFENRPGYKPPPVTNEVAVDTWNPEPGQSQATSEAASEPQPTTVLVFRDGHQLEIGNYVIVGNTLYNMSGAYRQYKIQLADLDLDATIKANEDRGVEFKVPGAKKPA